MASNGKTIKWLAGILAVMCIALMGAVLTHLQYSKVDKEAYQIEQRHFGKELTKISTQQLELTKEVQKAIKVMEIHIATDN